MLGGPERRSNRRRRVQFGTMTLAVVDRQAMAFETRGPGDRQGRRRIEPAGEQNHGAQ
jgi:hypothetical protein